jgi:uncharacterized protein (TIGR00730 family)
LEDDDPPRKGTRRRTDTEQLQDEIRASDSHARPDRDLALLARPELRSARLQLEYLKPELELEALGVVHTIVVFGSTRLLDPETAREQLERAPPGDEAEHERARAAVERSHYYEVGRELGRLVGRCGTGSEDHRLIVMTGGGPGGMEAANRGAHDVGAASAGLNITLPREQQPNPYITPELSFQFRYFALRKLHFMLRARALIALPGGYGTFDELFETLCLIQTGKRAPLPVVLVGERFWRRAVDFEFLVEEGMIDEADLSLFSFAETAPQVWQQIQHWYLERGLSVFDEQDPGTVKDPAP